PVEPKLTLVVPEGPTDCPDTPADYDDWALPTGQSLVGIAGGVGPMILGGTVTADGMEWQVMGSDLHQQFIFAAPLPLAVGGDLVYLGGTSLGDGSWMWAPDVGQEWRTTLAQDTMAAAGHVVACMRIAYGV
ncbi:MAG: hypothetical protein LBL55_05875, partial [Propionibacteriaceae bacterium]|nr:hypothetical protein [Propionibacteriaceae bacterium]